MHELSIAQALISEVSAVALENKALSVRSVKIRIGALSGVERGALEMAFPFAAEGTICEGSVLQIEDVPSEMECRACGKTSEPVDFAFVCSECGSNDVEVKAGREMMIESVNLELPD